MKTTRTILAIFFVMFVLAVAAPARAQTTVAECTDRIDLIQTDLNAIFSSGGIAGHNPTRTYSSLTSKLQGAISKLDQHKFADALQKLQDFKTAVIALSDAAKPKLTAADAALLLDGNDDSDIDEGVNGAIACVALLP